VLDVTIDRPTYVETTALGAAYLAGLATSVFPNLGAISQVHKIDKTFEPRMAGAERTAHLSRWQDAVRRARASGPRTAVLPGMGGDGES
jgi:glycerol kinase